MCIATKLLDDYIEVLKRKRNKVSKETTICDRKIVEFYHDLEGKEFEVQEGYQLAMDLKHILERRRNLKFFHIQLTNSIRLQRDMKLELAIIENNYFKKSNGKYQTFLLEEEFLLI